ncbi:phospholipase A2 inhibitor and Ly6/PLAUR domain-containing protein-like [Paroedura picta]|uniref:phospholipase A2 inhibitor and Ly6/PLAUR domain-containing protein-like n=1 Tax=Paroedura picta TaxID=143630 RepID=UPI00405626CA
MAAPVFFFPLAVLLATARRGSSIQCQKCNHIDGPCTDPVTACEPEFDTCGAILIETRKASMKVKITRKFCTTHHECTPGAIFMDLENGFRESGNSVCCKTDGCNTATLTVPTRNENFNGLWCPFCYAAEPATCKEEEIIRCRGSENQCFTRKEGREIVKTDSADIKILNATTHKGCATESFCANVADTGVSISGSTLVVGGQTIECRAASNGTRPAGSREQNAVNSGPRIEMEATQLCLQAFVGLLMTTSFYRPLF